MPLLRQDHQAPAPKQMEQQEQDRMSFEVGLISPNAKRLFGLNAEPSKAPDSITNPSTITYSQLFLIRLHLVLEFIRFFRKLAVSSSSQLFEPQVRQRGRDHLPEDGLVDP